MTLAISDYDTGVFDDISYLEGEFIILLISYLLIASAIHVFLSSTLIRDHIWTPMLNEKTTMSFGRFYGFIVYIFVDIE